MQPIFYNKPPITFANQISRLKQRGLIIKNSAKANHLLEKISYYRLSGYWYPLLEGVTAVDKERHIFKKGAKLETAFKMYCFDRELRQLIQAELEKIEVAIRSAMIYQLSHSHGAFWYTEPSLFKNTSTHTKSLTSISMEYNRSDEQFISAFKNKYSDPFPPSWMMLEITSFGTLSILYGNLLPGKTKKNIAHTFGLDDKTFTSWLHSIVYLRNICAHHSRLWNRSLSIQPKIPQNPKYTWLKSQVVKDRVYIFLSMIVYLSNQINPHHRFKKKLNRLFKKYPNIDPYAMGFPSDWRKELLWKISWKERLPKRVQRFIDSIQIIFN